MRNLFRFLTHDWLNKVLSLGLAIIIFMVVDDKISDEKSKNFTIRFGPYEPNVRENTIFLTLKPGYTASLIGQDQGTGEARPIAVHFKGPRQLIEDISDAVTGDLQIKQIIQDEKLAEEVWDIDESQIKFKNIDSSRIQIQIPDLQIRVLRVISRHVNVTADLAGFKVRPGYRIGEPVPDQPTVKVTCPKRYFNNFTSVQMTPREEDFKQPDSSWRLQKVMNIRPFRIVRPADIPPGVQFSAEPTEMNVKIPLHPLDDRLDIEVRIVLRLPPGDTLGGVIPSAKTRETFSFIGPQRLLQECKKLEGTAQEIQAEIDLARLSSDRIKELKNEGIRVKPEFVYPSEAAKRLLRCEHPKSIWVSIPKPKDK